MKSNKAILTINNSEYDILRMNQNYQRDTDAKGRPCSVYYGGEILVEVESTGNSELFRLMTHKEMPPVSGKIEVFSGDDEMCVRRIEFKEAYLYAYKEALQCASSLPMITSIAISPLRLDYNNNMLRLDRKWPRAPHGWQKYEPEEVKYAKVASTEEKKNMKITDAYWIDKNNKKQRNLLTDYPVKLYIVLEEYTSGAEATFHFEDVDNEGWEAADYSGTIDKDGVVEIDNFQLILKQ